MWKKLQKFSGLALSHQSECLSDTVSGSSEQSSNAEQKRASHMNEDFQTECGTSRGTLSKASSNQSVIVLDRPTHLIAQTALNKLFINDDRYAHFSICMLDDIMDATGLGSSNHPNYKKLRALHCVKYRDMPKELFDMLPQMVNEILTEEVRNEAAISALAGIVSQD